MPEIGECYSIAYNIPPMGEVQRLQVSKNFSKYICKQAQDLLSLNKINAKFGQSIAYGKSIWFPIETDFQIGILVSQLGMSGSWFLDSFGRDTKNDHLVVYFKDHKLRYSDPRMFGKMRIFWFEKNEQELLDKVIKNYKWGIDPYQSTEEQILNKIIKWQKSNKPVKALLLEQNLIFGVGNYLASEILLKAKVNPLKKGSTLDLKELKLISKYIKSISALAVNSGGYSFAGGYLNPQGGGGSMAKHIKAYGKEGQKCSQCKKDNIKKIEVAGRGTFYCPSCQRK